MKKHAFIIGAQRCGTTFLAKAMQAHPDITFAQPIFPEPKFYLKKENQDKGGEVYRGALFSTDSTAKLFVEKSTSYIEFSLAAERIAHHFPDASIIVLLRNPVDRAISNYFFTKKHGLETLVIEEAFAADEERLLLGLQKAISVSPFAYKARGHYINYLTNWRNHFPDKNIHLLFFEEMISDTRIISNLFERLGLAQLENELPNHRINIGEYPEEFQPSEKLISQLRAEFAPSVAKLDQEFGTNASALWGFTQ